MSLIHFRLFCRIISRSKEVYLLKIITLAIAIACSTLVSLFSINEFGYDQFHYDPGSIFRVLQRNIAETYGGNRLSSRIPYKVFTSLESKSRDSIVVSRMKVMEELSVVAEKQTFQEQKIHAADNEITRILSFDVVAGSLSNFDDSQRTALLSSSMALRYFGTVNAWGKKIKIYSLGDTVQFSVAAVYKDFPPNSHEEFNIFIRFDTLAIQALKFSPKDAGIYCRVFHGEPSNYQSKINKEFDSSDFTYNLQPMPEIYIGPRVLGEDARHGDKYSVLILVSIACLIFFLALTSFINLTTLTLPHRSKEIAVRKLAGTNQLNLILMFVTESFIIVGISVLLGILLLFCTSNWIYPILSVNSTSLFLEGDSVLMLVLAGLLLVLGLAPLLTAFKFILANPVRLLSSQTITFPRFKRTIGFLQLGISIFLIIASIVMRRQVNFSLAKEPGRNYDQIIYMRFPKDLTNEGLRNLRSSWKKNNANIIDVMGTSQLPKMLGNHSRNVVGVVKDMSGQFNQPEKPIKISLSPYFNYNFLCVRVLEVDIRKTVRYLSTYFGSTTTANKISFLNKRFEEWLGYQDRLNILSEILMVISGLLSCCAIYGLSVSLVRDKLKQIAIHKICGASTINIARILIKEFARQMLIALLIFGPVTYVFLRELLRSFVYSTHLNLLDPVFPIVYCSLIILIICGFQALNLNRADLSSALRG